MSQKRVARNRVLKHLATNDFFRPFALMALVIVVGFVGSIAANKETTGKDLVLPQFETNKGHLITPWLHERDSDKKFWTAAYSMAGAPVSDFSANSNAGGKHRALLRLMLKMKHDIEHKGLISATVESDLIKSFQSSPRR